VNFSVSHNGPFSPLDVRYLGKFCGRDQFLLLSNFGYYPASGESIEVPFGFIFDFDSVPRLPLVYWLLKGRATQSSAVHDFLYETKTVSRRAADQVFLQAMRDEGVAWYYRIPIYLGVRIGGWLGWNRPGVHPNLPEL